MWKTEKEIGGRRVNNRRSERRSKRRQRNNFVKREKESYMRIRFVIIFTSLSLVKCPSPSAK
jgi:hypothetical protein